MSNSQPPRKRGGPKTRAGKLQSSQNSRKHGFFACEFSFSKVDEPEFLKLRAGLRRELKPNNALLDLIFEDLVASAWKIRPALRLEQQALRKEFLKDNDGVGEELKGAGFAFRFGLNGRKNEQAIKLIGALRAHVESKGSLAPEFEEEVCQIFGPNFWKILSEWETQDSVSFWLYRLTLMSVERSRVYGMDMPQVNLLSPADKAKYLETNTLNGTEALRKLLALYENLLVNLNQQTEAKSGLMFDESLARLDLGMRYLTTARREFYRSLREYQDAKKSS